MPVGCNRARLRFWLPGWSCRIAALEIRTRIAVLWIVPVSINTQIMWTPLGRAASLLLPLRCRLLTEGGMKQVEHMLARVCTGVVICVAAMYADNCLMPCTRAMGKCYANPIIIKHLAAQPLRKGAAKSSSYCRPASWVLPSVHERDRLWRPIPGYRFETLTDTWVWAATWVLKGSCIYLVQWWILYHWFLIDIMWNFSKNFINFS